jgi:ribosomal protein S18 acetylase RimI-like enzyme
MELVDAALAKAESNTYEVLVAAANAAEARGRRTDLLGYVCFGATPMTDATFDLYWIVVDPQERGRGVGTALLASTEETLRLRRARTLRIETSSQEGQGGAARFYVRHGYDEVGRILDFYRPGDDLLTFAKRL